VPPEDFSNAVSLGVLVFNVATIGGPAIAGFVLAESGPAVIYGLNALSFLAVIAALLAMRASGKADDERERKDALSLAALKEGLKFVWHTPIIVQTMTLDFVATFFASATLLLPIFAQERLHVGARVAVFGVATAAFGISTVYWFSLLMLAVTGAADTVSTVLRQTIRQLVTPNHLRGRMTSINMMFFMGGPQLGELEAGSLAALIGAPLSVVTGGLGSLICAAIAAVKSKSLMEFEI
jgi:MFS family permease